MLLNILQCTGQCPQQTSILRTVPTTEKYPSPNGNSTETDKPRSRFRAWAAHNTCGGAEGGFTNPDAQLHPDQLHQTLGISRCRLILKARQVVPMCSPDYSKLCTPVASVPSVGL